ncbi:hypothetical protein FN846DRAFT_960046 [Sphaerosporella brunnea]|uniref:Uncharacterized protein n=1 Tax=Sphaerosporella brunnea TaxID=1250544 RepID=A0A5J5ERR1_9PEZI|nr:hypothetical protein FN846DRAFT_960046 [Sphaerosporella brunnea]
MPGMGLFKVGSSFCPWSLTVLVLVGSLLSHTEPIKLGVGIFSAEPEKTAVSPSYRAIQVDRQLNEPRGLVLGVRHHRAGQKMATLGPFP